MAVSKRVRTQQWLEEALDQLPVKVQCPNCGQTVGRYRPGRVTHPSLVLPSVNFKCVRPGCRYDAVVVLDETIAN